MERNGPIGWLFVVGVLAVGILSRDSLVSREVPPFSLPETYGGRVNLSSYKGQPVLLVFWMTTCGACRYELPLLNRMATEFRSRGIEVMTIHLGGKAEARDYLRESRIGLTALVDEEGTTGESYRVSGVPKMVLVGADGNILRSHEGMLRESGLREWMDVSAPR